MAPSHGMVFAQTEPVGGWTAAGEVVLKRPPRSPKSDPATLVLTLVEAREIDTGAIKSPVLWRLSTTLPATTDTGEPSGSTGSEGTDGGTETGDSTGGEPPSVCDPQPEGAPFWLAVDWDEADPFLRETVELDVGCVVSSLASADGILSVGLDCDDAALIVDGLPAAPEVIGLGIFEAIEGEEDFPKSFDQMVSIWTAPGDSDYGMGELTPGEYVAFCPIPVGSTADGEGDGPPHFAQGMVETFTVA